jgi:hypothetical protein
VQAYKEYYKGEEARSDKNTKLIRKI